MILLDTAGLEPRDRGEVIRTARPSGPISSSRATSSPPARSDRSRHRRTGVTTSLSFAAGGVSKTLGPTGQGAGASS